jgi:hypothetical protein
MDANKKRIGFEERPVPANIHIATTKPKQTTCDD